MKQLEQYDRFLDENDWDIYYWTTQESTPTSHETAEGGSSDIATPAAQGTNASSSWKESNESGEWAQTIGRFKPAHRPVPTRWKNSEILALLRKHVIDRSAGGVHEGTAGVQGKELAQSVKGIGGGGLGRMPEVQNFDV